ncbi:MAG: K(+)-transporting ATPase subunit C [Bacteroidetes bacterium]|jgi:K+-transporting ATPase ATPase C chain|nr:K(+)-transporting ATPase subunit C [Bacteroidota bacterium]MBP8917333.1 K(+)-transporting ATPase subunit C [Chitinophagales bacterium]MBP9796239.1 K(+)-transporting ATPase subunit C [Chitinophagales bacterium]
MKSNIFSAIKLTLVCLIFFMVIYPLILFGIAQLSPNNGKGNIIEQDGKIYYSNIGQTFTDDKYFYSRPSAVGYNAAGSGGSNKGPSNPQYLEEVKARIDTFLFHNPGINKSEIPSELVTASGSGLDPNISVAAANVQVKRIALVRNLQEADLYTLIENNTEKPLFGVFGTEKINVLKLNLELDNLK